ncbi:unnamed protein product [Pleuronectes platessa]|uniref:ADP-ribosylation factor-like protein 10 n=1 Tax=Pleuronectes platessa TaxID=8262 RepID=A0A9N7YMC2_PLEPL|nr:unnamed protein product [Pleuronectes platessa]
MSPLGSWSQKPPIRRVEREELGTELLPIIKAKQVGLCSSFSSVRASSPSSCISLKSTESTFTGSAAALTELHPSLTTDRNTGLKTLIHIPEHNEVSLSLRVKVPAGRRPRCDSWGGATSVTLVSGFHLLREQLTESHRHNQLQLKSEAELKEPEVEERGKRQVLVLGLDGAGKSSMLQGLTPGPPAARRGRCRPTRGFNFMSLNAPACQLDFLESCVHHCLGLRVQIVSVSVVLLYRTSVLLRSDCSYRSAPCATSRYLATLSIKSVLKPERLLSGASCGRRASQLEVGSSAQLDVGFGGGEDLRRYWSEYLRKTHVLVYVVDSSDRRRLPLAKAELHLLLKAEPQLPVVILGNKQQRRSIVSSELNMNLRRKQEPLSDAADLISDLRVTSRQGMNEEDKPDAIDVSELHDALSLGSVTEDRKLVLLAAQLDSDEALRNSCCSRDTFQDLLLQLV